MPWIAIPFSDARRRRALGQRLGVRGIPALATIGPDGVIINQAAKGAAMQDPVVSYYCICVVFFKVIGGVSMVGDPNRNLPHT